jgi:glycosyltransferase involved in cell wall biosynthesis
MKRRSVVYLLSHMYDNVSGGAGTYAHYLYNIFKNSNDFDFDFILVTHDVNKSSKNILKTKDYNDFYQNIEEYYKAVKIHSKGYEDVIVHANTAIELYFFKKTNFKLIANVNDYEVVDIYKFIPNFLLWYKVSAVNKILGKIKARYYEKNVLNRVDLIMTNSNYTKNRIIKGYDLPKNKIAVIHKAVDISLFNSEGDSLNIKNNKLKTILFVGTDWQKKGLKELLEAIRLLKNDNYYLILTILGIKNENERNKIKKIVDELNLDNVNIHGLVSRNKISTYYMNSDLFVLPTKLEAFGVSYIEAMSSGLFIIGSNLGGVPEIIKSNVNGLLLDCITREEISSKIKMFLDNEIDIEKITFQARKTANSFKSEVMLGKIYKKYLDLFKI